MALRERLWRRGPAGAIVAGVGAVVLTLVAVAVIVVATTRASGGGEESVGTTPIAAAGTISPQIALFGDTVNAWVDVTLDRSQIGPALVHVNARFEGWTRVGAPIVERHDSGDTTFLRTSYVLRCLDSLCVPTRGPLKFDFKPARISYLAPQGDATERLVVDAQWPALFVHSRLEAADATQRDPLRAPWHANLTSLPAVTYRIGPWSLVALLLAAGIAFLVVAALLLYRLLPERREAPALPPPPPPTPVLSPLEQALVLLEAQAAEDGVAERRRALELVADELAGWDERSLERTARTLAWSEDEPAAEATQALAAMVRAQLDGRSNGRPA